ncbi:hypothetical protein DBR32_10225 [Taibaiella sp. KBW10]|uniref:DUF1573 domain-containing protein n=1 Tax=Taibaiella sp. KBW10 TaxID=2153357 RepID=UPI000F5AAB41|nr:DUF1573 domain-containing protein [Taibaiella sp. KBW10]RQO31072.1 hypothetical protein DBR32_10225 [Taibaiella sp. KBW10]
MNSNLKTILLTVLTLSCFTIALVELSGVSKTALLNKLNMQGNKANAAHNLESTGNLKELKTPAQSDRPKTTVRFDKDTFNFGTIKDGDVVEHTYKFKNTGANPLIIDDVIATCGCTIPSYTKTPVPPGQNGEIKISFNSKGKAGNVDKAITVISNAEQDRIPLKFKALVQ